MHHSVLVADCDEMQLCQYRRFLLSRGYQVQSAMGGVECVARLRDGCPEILILDMELPWGGGAGVLAALRENADVLHPCSIIVTGQVAVSTLQDVSIFPVIRCVRKPYRLSTVLEETISDLAAFGRRPPPVGTSVETLRHVDRG